MLPPTSTRARCLEHAPDERRRRRFALGAGDGHHRAAQPARRQLQLADHRDAGRTRQRDSGSSIGTPGLSTIRSAPVNESARWRAELERHARRLERCRVGDGRLPVGQRDPGAATREQQRGRDAASCGADHQHALALD